MLRNNSVDAPDLDHKFTMTPNYDTVPHTRVSCWLASGAFGLTMPGFDLNKCDPRPVHQSLERIGDKERKYGWSGLLPGYLKGYYPPDFEDYPPEKIELVELSRDNLTTAMLIRKASDAKGEGGLTYGELTDWTYDHVRLLYDDRIPTGEEFDRECGRYAEKHEILWKHRNDPGDDGVDARRALWMLRAYDPRPDVHPGRGTNYKLDHLFHQFDDKYGDYVLERVAMVREAIDPRWVMGDVAGLEEQGEEARLMRVLDERVSQLVPDQLLRSPRVESDEVMVKAYADYYFRYAHSKDAIVVGQQEAWVKYQKAVKAGDRIAADHWKFTVNDCKDGIEVKQRKIPLKGADAIHASIDRLGLMARQSRKVFKSYRSQIDDPTMLALFDRYWYEPYERRADSFREIGQRVGMDMYERGFGREAYDACRDSLVGEAKEKIAAQVEAERQAAHAKSEAEKAARVRRANLQHRMDRYEQDRATRAAIGRPHPGDEKTAEEIVMEDRAQMMADTNLSYDELYDDDPDHDFDPANW